MHRSSPQALFALALAGSCAIPLAAQATCDFAPSATEVVLDTDFATVITSCGPVNVAGGVFVFRNVTIPLGVHVRGVGSRPLVLIVTGSLQLDGSLSVDGGKGARVDTLNSANFPTPGGVGVCGGSNGGLGSPESTKRSVSGASGWAFANTVAVGGGGGLLSCVSSCGRGSAGGGGVFATAGDPYYPLKAVGTSAVQQLGFGGGGCRTAPRLPGGAPGAVVFVDPSPDNDFFGVGVDLFARRVVTGELRTLLGGQGGGGGGDLAVSCAINDPLFVNDPKGGGGGAGGGVVAVLALGPIRIGATGRISADGGNGGGGEQAGSNNQGGGGAGGSGGMVVLASTTSIELSTHGETYANGDYSFVVSADGGAGTQGVFGGVEVAGKYPPPSGGARTWDLSPIGGLGGLGVVQLSTPFGNNADGTNTIFDDNVHVVQNGARLTGAQKQRYLAWRGYFDGATQRWVDDAGQPTNIGDNEGDIRPAPILLPLF